MPTLKRRIEFAILLLAFPFCVSAQNDSIRLRCPIGGALLIPPPKAEANTSSDLCVVVQSKMDTTVMAVTAGKISSIEANPDEKGKWDVVFFTRYKKIEYYFWYAGLTNVIVKPNQVIKEGQAIGSIHPGGKIELLMYDFETPVDPMKYLTCE